jgi:RNA polymerase sigma-70 factor (ECF subfamily)
MEPPLDASLREARSGSQSAYAELWRQLSPAVCGYVRAKGAADPEATTNDVFLGAFGALADFAGDAAQFRGLLFTIAQRRLVDEFRRRARRPVEVEWTPDLDDRADASAHLRVLDGGRDEDARALLDGLPQDQRDVMMLRVFGDLTIDQIAHALGKTPGAVKALQRRGLNNLRRRLGSPAPVSDLSNRRQ